MTLSQNEATRFISAIDYRIEKALGRGTVLEITYGDVDVVSGKTASALLGGDVNPSYGFRIPSGLNVVSGDRVRVAIDPRGFRYIEEVLASTAYPKLEVDPVRGRLLLGDGTVAPTLGSAGQALVVNAGGTALEFGDVDAGAPSESAAGGFTIPSGDLNLVNGDVFLTSGKLYIDNGDSSFGPDGAQTYAIKDERGIGAAITLNIYGQWMMKSPGDTNPRIETYAPQSIIKFGDGTNPVDTNLYRSAADTLKTDDDFVVAGDLTVSGAIIGTEPNVNVYTSSTTWNKPANLAFIIVEVQGGGGGGGGVATTGAGQSACSGGGAGGGYARKLFTAADLAGDTTFDITVGAAGAAGASGANAGGTGGNSSFAGTGITTVQGDGGGGGSGGTASSSTLVVNGSGGSSASGGDINVSGGSGGGGLVVSGTRTNMSFGGSSHLGGTARATFGGNAGQQYGGGGSGSGISASTSAAAGTAGAAGVVIVTEYFGP